MNPNVGIEFHDATVHGVRPVGPDAVVEMTVFVHSSVGRPGIDAGTGWYQRAELVVSDAVTEREPSTWPLHVSDDAVTVDSERLENMVPLPFDRAGRVRVEIQAVDGSLVMSGARLRIELKGSPSEPEEFPGSA